MWATVSEVMAEPGWPMGEDPSCFLPLTGTHGARHRLPWAPGNPNKASSLVGTRKGARTPSVPVEPLSYILAHIMVGSTPACFCCSVCEPWGAVMLLLSLVQWGCTAVCWTAVGPWPCPPQCVAVSGCATGSLHWDTLGILAVTPQPLLWQQSHTSCAKAMLTACCLLIFYFRQPWTSTVM